MEDRKHYLAGITAFLIWGFFSLPLRAIRAYTPGEILYFRILFTLLLLAAIIGLFKRKDLARERAVFAALTRPEKMRAVWLTLLGGAFLSMNWLIFIITINRINVRTASFAYLVCPVITAVLGFALLREKLSSLQWTSVVLCIGSCVLIGMSSVHELQYSLLTAASYAAYLVSQRRNQGFDRLINLGVQVAFSFLLLSASYPFLVEAVPSDGFFFSIVFLIAALFTALPLFLNLYALNRINSATIGILLYINPLMNFVLAVTFFHESMNALQLVGYLIILVALVVFNYPHLRRIRAVS